MVKIYLVRHCEAAGNRARIFQGSTDLDVSELGLVQLKYLKKRFSDIHIDRVYSGPLKRAYKTALAVAEDKSLEVITDPLLTEIDGGVIEGKSFAEIFSKHADLQDCWDNHPQDFAPEGGEPMRHAYERIWQGVSGIAKKPENSGKTLLIASHGGVIRNLLCRITLGSIERLSEMPWADNTAVSLLVFDRNGVHAEFVNDSSHVPSEFMPKRNRIASQLAEGAK